MSSGKSSKNRIETRSKVKSVLATLERLSGSSTPDRDQIRYLCHKLLQLVSDQESAKKDVSSKAGLDILLLTLEHKRYSMKPPLGVVDRWQLDSSISWSRQLGEQRCYYMFKSCNDQATCVALIGTLTEISRSGSVATKRLLSHDVTRVLLHVVAYNGADFDWRLLSAIMHLLAKLGPKDRRFALRARLTGSLPVILNTVRSSFTHSSQSRLLPVSLNVLKLALTSSTNAALLGRAGAVHVMYRIVVSLSKKQIVPLKNAYATLNLLVRYSKANAGRALKLGIMPHLLKTHQNYHKHDFKYHRHCAIRKSLLNVMKNLVSLKIGRKAFTDSNGLLVLYKTCKDYLGVDPSNKSVESFFSVAIIIIRRCQLKMKLPITNTRCSFGFPLPGIRPRSNSTESSSNLLLDSDEDLNDSNVTNDESDDLGETLTKRRESGTSVSATSDSLARDFRPKPAARTNEELKMYEEFFPELSDFQVSKGGWLQRARTRPHTGEEIDALSAFPKSRNPLHSLSDVGLIEPNQPGNNKFSSYDVRRSASSFPDNVGRNGTGSTSANKDFGSFSRLSYTRDSLVSSDKRLSTDTGRLSDDSDFFFPPSCMVASELEHTNFSGSTRAEMANVRMEAAEAIQKVASNVKSVKELINQLSEADAWGSVAPDTSEKQVNKKNLQKLIRAKLLEDLARILLPEDIVNKLVYTNDDRTLGRMQINFAENGQLFQADIQPPSDLPMNDAVLAGNRRPNSGQTSSESPSLIRRPKSGLVVKLPSQDPDSSSASVSDDTWPGVYLEKAKSGRGSLSSLSSIAERRSACSTASSGDTPQFQTLQFNSHFESGNLRAAFQTLYNDCLCLVVSNKQQISGQKFEEMHRTLDHRKLLSKCGFSKQEVVTAMKRVREYEYDLILNPDCNSNHHFQWFYFEVSQMKTDKPYRFNIINCEKKGSVINEGMQPVMYSMTEAKLGRPQWVRIGNDTCYYRNHFLRNLSSAGGSKKSTYFTLTFTVTFRHDEDTCYFAYHYPYTYTKLQLDLQQLLEKIDPTTMYVRKQTFCYTLAGNPVPVLTITAPPDFAGACSEAEAIEELKSRPYIFLTARVHPGEANASWTMRGSLKLLLTPPTSKINDAVNPLAPIADELRNKYIFKIVPMLNPDGVINGHHRCSLTGEDLNRTWVSPQPNLFPTIYHTKGLLQYLYSIKKAPLVYCDYHGHSRRMNVFIYGCSRKDTIDAGETNTVADGPLDQGHKTLPKLLDRFAAPFSFKNCSFVVEKTKLSTARVVVWKEFGVARSYTMESTYCGCDQGPLRGRQINTRELEDMGSKFCEVLLHLSDIDMTRDFPLYDTDDEEEILNQLNSTSRESDDERQQRSPRCPANSDAELTPDDEIWNLDEAYGVYPSANENENNSSFRTMLEEQRKSAGLMDLSFWRYELDDIEASIDYQQPMIMSDISDVTSDQSTVTMEESSADTGVRDAEPRYMGTYVGGRISPVTGRVHDVNGDDVVTTAPRPFESGLVLKKAPQQSSSPNSPSTSKRESKNQRSKKRITKPKV